MSIRAYITSRSLPEAVSSHRSISGRPAAAHRHPDCKHFFFVLDGEGILRADDDELKLSAGDVVMLEENEVHWFENRSDANFEFIELWVPAPPTPTVWVSDDQCTWAPNEPQVLAPIRRDLVFRLFTIRRALRSPVRGRWA